MFKKYVFSLILLVVTVATPFKVTCNNAKIVQEQTNQWILSNDVIKSDIVFTKTLGKSLTGSSKRHKTQKGGKYEYQHKSVWKRYLQLD